MANHLAERLTTAAFAFRGYNTTNLGRTPELLAHPAYGAIVQRHLQEAAEVTSDAVCRHVDLVDRVRRREETTLASYDEAIALIVAVELAQIELLEQLYGVKYSGAKLAYGYSLGELAAVVASGLFAMEDALRLPLSVAADAVALTEGVTLGVLFSRGPLLDIDQVQRLCLDINLTGQGVVGMSSILAPNTVLLLGQGDTLDRFSAAMHDAFPARVLFAQEQRAMAADAHADRLATQSAQSRGRDDADIARRIPQAGAAPAVAGDRQAELQRLQRPGYPLPLDRPSAAAVGCGLRDFGLGRENGDPRRPGSEPDPRHISALRDNVTAQMTGRSLNSLSMRAISQAVKRPWLTALLPSRTALLRAPLVEHVILEDWLLAQKAP